MGSQVSGNTVAVSSAATSDGVVVTLTGRLGRAAAPRLRRALLVPVEPGQANVVVDAGDVTEVSEPCLAVLLAAAAWTVECGGQFVYSRVGAPLRALADELGIAQLLEPADRAWGAQPRRDRELGVVIPLRQPAKR